MSINHIKTHTTVYKSQKTQKMYVNHTKNEKMYKSKRKTCKHTTFHINTFISM